ncbi:restriction system modified-DNA reader domain-containing protein [Micromonospora craniellae]|uniref:restriction system modified-DNA reader domain-containing protein n=1 Tax=Micromonospora craniellae TaxID=2294034 RepID=UPI001314E86F|nr:hypothetical protein [Micromonospora craniellae]QOC94391.1 hypothetical protein ID554_12870 [Micromonospora craniellae]
MHQIDIDNQVHATLRELGRTGDTFNDVLRGVLNLNQEGPRLMPGGHRRAWNSKPPLGALVRAGILQPGQRLIWNRPRIGEQHTVTVDVHGNLITAQGRICPTPDSATRAIVGYPAAGWPAFRTEDGVSLQQLREQHTARPGDGGHYRS